MRDSLLLYVNGTPHRITGSLARRTLSRFLREDLGLTGTKIVCEEGDCGACTVLVGRVEHGVLRYRPVNSCIHLLLQMDCAHVVTVEGLAPRGSLTPLQESMVRCHGAQCGYCTPGFVMAMAGMLEDNARPSAAEVREAVTGNLCRCTGYEPIVRAGMEVRSQPRIAEVHADDAILGAIREVEGTPVRIGTFFKPVDIGSAVAFRAEYPGATIVQGATDVGVWTTKRGFDASAILSLDAVPGLREIRLEDGILSVGACATLTQFAAAVREVVPELHPILGRFGSPQIRNAGTLAGNVANASPIADMLPFLFVMQAELELTGRTGIRRVPIRDFYRGYKQLDLRTDEIITRIAIPLPRDGETLRLYKVSKRSHLDIASFTAAMLLRRTDGGIEGIRIAYGGVAPVVLRLPKTEEYLAGKPVARETFAAAGELAREEVAPISDVRGSREYRLQLAENILSRFYYDVAGESVR